jgi:hypothetical protein
MKQLLDSPYFGSIPEPNQLKASVRCFSNQPSLPIGSGRVGDDVEAGDDLRLDRKHSVGVIDPWMQQLLVARDLARIVNDVRSAGSDDAPARPALRIEIVRFIGHHHSRVRGSYDSGDRGGQPGADDDPAVVHKMINWADRWQRVEGEYHSAIVNAG